MIKVLNLYSGLGGNRFLWEGVKVTAVEFDEDIARAYASLFPDDEVVVGDAHAFLLKNFHLFDFIWASPPCPSHSKLMVATRHKKYRYPDMALYQEIIFLDQFAKGFWLIENVVPYYQPLIKPTSRVGRHLFWSNFGFSTKGI